MGFFLVFSKYRNRLQTNATKKKKSDYVKNPTNHIMKDSDVIDARVAYERGEKTVKQLAEVYGVTNKYMSKLVTYNVRSLS